MLATRGDPLLLADWERVLMIHYEIAPEVLQPYVPFELDVRDGHAYVSLVAFTLRDMRPWWGGAFTKPLLFPIATHEFLNLRTYVKHEGEPGIYFLAEWLPNRLSVLLGRPVFGLPYRLGAHRYDHSHESGLVSGRVAAQHENGVLRYKAKLGSIYERCTAGSLTEFLMERYTAFTEWLRLKRCFRIWHLPWLQCEAEIRVPENTLMSLTGTWAHEARLVGANYSPGLTDVWMGRPVLAEPFSFRKLNPHRNTP
jgi:uncharacterized protein YqjF (DUF2071 family)